MNQLAILSLLLLNFLLFGCGNTGSSGSSNSVDEEITFPDKETMLAALEKSRVVCGEAGLDCPNNVAKLTFWQKEGDQFSLGVCSGTLIQEDYILTNSHCIPDNLRTGASCDSQILIQFPETRTSRSENINCISVVKVYDYENSKNPDLAVLRVERSKLNNFDSISTLSNDFTHKKNVYAYTMNPSGGLDPYLGTIVRKDCEVSYKNIIEYGNAANGKDFYIGGSNCNVIGGNSGSGLFNEQGQLIGAIHQKLNIKMLKKLFDKNFISYDKLDYIGKAVNFSCLSSKALGLRKSCQIHEQEMTINKYFELKKKEYSLEHMADDDIEAIITSDLNVRLSVKSDNFSFRKSLKWLKSRLDLIGGSNAVKLILEKY